MFNKEDVILFAKNEASCYKEKIILFCDYNRPEERYNIFLNYYCPDLSKLFNIDASFIFENFIINKSVDIKNINYYIKNNIFYKLNDRSYTFKTKGGLL